MVTCVWTFLTEKIGIKIPEGARTVAVEKPVPMVPEGPPYSTNPSNSVTFGFKSKLIELYFSMVGVTSNTTPTSRNPGFSSSGATVSKDGVAD